MSNTLAKILGQGAGGIDVWASGKTVQQYDFVISPADLEIYQRKTATGSGTIDPADDLTNYTAASYERTSALPLREPDVSSSGHGPTAQLQGLPIADMGVITANTRTLALSLAGRGSLDALGFNVTQAGTCRVEVLVDGRSVFDLSRAGSASSGMAWPIVGLQMGATTAMDYLSPVSNALEFRRSLQVYFTPNFTTVTARNYIRSLYKAQS
jgi:hypothetical protein